MIKLVFFLYELLIYDENCKGVIEEEFCLL